MISELYFDKHYLVICCHHRKMTRMEDEIVMVNERLFEVHDHGKRLKMKMKEVKWVMKMWAMRVMKEDEVMLDDC